MSFRRPPPPRYSTPRRFRDKNLKAFLIIKKKDKNTVLISASSEIYVSDGTQGREI